MISLCLFLACVAPPAQAERRVALVVGNEAYAHATRLNNPVNDARDISHLAAKPRRMAP